MTSTEDSSASSNQSEDSGSDYDDVACESTDFCASRQGTSSVRKYQKPCRYYNDGFCRDGKRCAYLHVCKYYFKGNCRDGANCELRHRNVSESATSATRPKRKTKKGNYAERSSNKQYQWQVKKDAWMNIKHDSVIEAQYSLPWAKGIKLFNTIYGKLYIDYNKMKIHKEGLQVRRQLLEGSEKDVWCWYYYKNNQWTEYGKKDLNGKRMPVQSAAIERKYQKKLKGAIHFEAGRSTYKISFQEMKQTNMKTGRKRKVRRRPKLLASPVQDLARMLTRSHLVPLATATTSPKSPVWQFQGNSGKWYNFKHRSATDTECSISSNDIEVKYQRDPASTLTFTAGTYQYKLDLSAMQQTNLTSGTTRRIRRIEE